MARLSQTGAEMLANSGVAKSSPIIFWQNPPAGTPLIAGSTVQIKAESLDDVTLGTLAPTVGKALAQVSLTDLADVVEKNHTLLTYVQAGSLKPDEGRPAANALKSALAEKGYTVNPTEEQAAAIVLALGRSMSNWSAR